MENKNGTHVLCWPLAAIKLSVCMFVGIDMYKANRFPKGLVINLMRTFYAIS